MQAQNRKTKTLVYATGFVKSHTQSTGLYKKEKRKDIIFYVQWILTFPTEAKYDGGREFKVSALLIF